MRSFSKTIACLCLLLTVWSAVAVVVHRHTNGNDTAKCTVCAAAHFAASKTGAPAAAPTLVAASSFSLQPDPIKFRLLAFALSVRPPPVS